MASGSQRRWHRTVGERQPSDAKHALGDGVAECVTGFELVQRAASDPKLPAAKPTQGMTTPASPNGSGPMCARLRKVSI
jgi:hypothetical protein